MDWLLVRNLCRTLPVSFFEVLHKNALEDLFVSLENIRATCFVKVTINSEIG